ncbi:hypothetical protein tb265_49230 [Gemmatimonadetes bacterium T265]|nr:hypothetical protein tb265_49230 [Gemmatimonadetes bacterium T265]
MLLLGWTLVYGFGSWLLEYVYASVGAARPTSVATGSKNVIYALVWAPLLAAAVALTDWWPVRSATDGPRLLLHGAAIVAAPFAWGTAAYYLCLTFVPGWAPWGVWRTYLKTANGVLYVYVVVVGICHVAHWIRANRTREVAALRAAEAATRAQLQVLSLELQPHFLLNALNAVSALIYDDGDRAVEALRGLRAMLDQSVRSASVAEVALADEVASLATYTRVQELRFGDRLALTWRVAPGVEHAALPPFLLQPLVENAIKFSVEALPGRHEVSVEATRTGGDLVLRVSDDGVGVQAARGAPPYGTPARGFGHGLRNARARLQQTYGARHRLTLTAGPSGRGTVVEARIPFRIAGATPMALTWAEVAPHAAGVAPAGSA